AWLQGDLSLARLYQSPSVASSRIRSAVGGVRALERTHRVSRRWPELSASGFLPRDLRQTDDVAHLQPTARHHGGGGEPHRGRRLCPLSQAARGAAGRKLFLGAV